MKFTLIKLLFSLSDFLHLILFLLSKRWLYLGLRITMKVKILFLFEMLRAVFWTILHATELKRHSLLLCPFWSWYRLHTIAYRGWRSWFRCNRVLRPYSWALLHYKEPYALWTEWFSVGCWEQFAFVLTLLSLIHFKSLKKAEQIARLAHKRFPALGVGRVYLLSRVLIGSLRCLRLS